MRAVHQTVRRSSLARAPAIRNVLPAMSLAEIKAELPKLTPAERTALAHELQHFKPFDNAKLMARLSHSLDEAERGENVISKEEMLRTLRAAGRSV